MKKVLIILTMIILSIIYFDGVITYTMDYNLLGIVPHTIIFILRSIVTGLAQWGCLLEYYATINIDRY
jgi:hypothetical protein